MQTAQVTHDKHADASPQSLKICPEAYPYLHAKIAMLEGAEREREISLLNGEDEMSLVREENIARLKHLAVSLELDSGFMGNANQQARTRTALGTNDDDDAYHPNTRTTSESAPPRQTRSTTRVREVPAAGEPSDDEETDPHPALTTTPNPTPPSPAPADQLPLPPPDHHAHPAVPQTTEAAPLTVAPTVLLARETASGATPEAAASVVPSSASVHAPACQAPSLGGNTEAAACALTPTPPTVHTQDIAQSASATAAPSPLVLDLSDAPSWLRAQHAQLESASIPPEMYPTWNNIIGSWLALERALGFESMVRNYRWCRD